MNEVDKIAVCSRSFSRNLILREELLEIYTQVRFNDEGIQLEGAKLIDFLKGHSKAIIGLEKMTDDILSKLPELKVVGKFGVGLDTIDLGAMTKYGKRLGWTPGTNKRAVSELVISLAISLLRHIPSSHQGVLSGNWRQQIGGQLSGRTIGVIGCNNIGRDVIELLQPWGCRFLAFDISYSSEFNAKNGVIAVDIEEL
jgi:D-3-phosphoglycerate dehydrogenase